jgi:tripartite-type tricarboxylate transporter receptor subunit TctC
MKWQSCLRLAALVVLWAPITAPTRADPVAEFYKGRTLTILVGQEPVTGYDIYARVLARHIGRHIPGGPQVIVQNMPGASGVNAANYLFGVAPKDGTMIGTFTPNVIVEPLLGNKAAKYGPANMGWVGNMEEGASMCGFRSDAGIARFEDAMVKEVLVGATGPTGPLGLAARAINALVGTKLKIIYGYKGSASVRLAIQKGEVQGVCGLTWSTIKATWTDELAAGRFKPIVQSSAKPQADLLAAGAVHIDQYLKTQEQRQMAELLFGTMVLGRVYAISADVPAARAQALRQAFSAALFDIDFKADAQKTNIDITFASGEQVAEQVKRFYAVPAPIVEKVKMVNSGT